MKKNKYYSIDYFNKNYCHILSPDNELVYDEDYYNRPLTLKHNEAENLINEWNKRIDEDNEEE